MRTLQTALLAGVAAAAIGFSGAALAQSAQTHVMTVRLPGGGVAEISYTGNVPPQISFASGPVGAMSYGAWAPVPSFWGPNSPFAMMDRISAEMDREAAAMFHQAEALTAAARSGGLSEAAMSRLPPGSSSYSFISTMSGNGVCTRSVEITSQGNDAPPHVVSHSSGNCGPSGGTTGSVALPTAPAPAARPDVVWTSAHGSTPYAGLVREIPPAQR